MPAQRSATLLLAWGLTLAGITFSSAPVCAQTNDAATAPSLQNEQNLNAVFQRAIQTLPPAQQTALRKAERAWIEFRTKNSDALEIAGRQRGLSAFQMQQMENFELIARTREVLQFINPAAASPDALPAAFDRADAALNATYKQLFETLDDAGKKSLREAQRAWIIFRDENARAFSNGAPAVTVNAAMVLTTMHRSDQLRGFLAGKPAPLPYYGVEPAKPVAPPPPAETPDPSFPDPFASVR